MYKENMKKFLEVTSQRWGTYDADKLIEECICIDDGTVVGVRGYGDLCEYIGRIPDIDMGDRQNLINALKVLVQNQLKRHGKEDIGMMETGEHGC